MAWGDTPGQRKRSRALPGGEHSPALAGKAGLKLDTGGIEHDEEGLTKLKTETLDRAEDVLKTALARFSSCKDKIQYMLARIYDEDARNTGYVWDKNKAIQGYTQLVSEYPHSRYVQEARERIEVLTR